MTYIDGVVVDVLEYAGVIVDLSLEVSWWRRRWTLGRVSRLQVETARRTHSRRRSTPAIKNVEKTYKNYCQNYTI